MDIFAQAAKSIISQQEAIMGPLALEQAKKVQGLVIDKASHDVMIEGDKTTALQHLVEQYKQLFGQTAVEVCRQAAKDFMKQVPPSQVPELLR
ncbi:MAG TPA: hypothetical protein VF272_04470 [Candidatus Saccharimonadia bacterium]